MPVDLSRVNVSLQQFQEISSGKYNAGEVKLESETELGKVNNHVHRTGANRTPLSHEEVIAVKTAFVKALRSGGVAADELARVRAQLGLAPEPGAEVDRTLRERSIRPLTRQQVREILDRNAAAINARADAVPGAARVRTSAQIYGEGGMRADRAGRRDEVNASLADSRTVAANRDVQVFERLVAGDFEGLTGDEARRMLPMAREKLASIREKSGENPPANDRPRVGLRLPGGQTVEIQARGSSADLLAQLEDAVFFLENRPYANDDAPVPPLSADQWNAAVRNALSGNAERPLPHDVARLEKELLAAARAKFGEEAVPPGATFRSILPGQTFAAIDPLVEAAGNDRRVGLAELRGALGALLERHGAKTVVERRLSEIAASLGLPADAAARYAASTLRRNPMLGAAIAAAGTAGDVVRALDEARPALEKAVRIHAAIDAARAAARGRFAAAFAAKTGLPASVAEGLPCAYDFLASCGFLGDDLASGRIRCESPEDVEAAFAEATERRAAAHAAQLAKVDTFGLGREAADTLKAQILGLQKVKPALYDLDKFRDAAAAVKPALANLAAALRAPGADKAAGLAALRTFTTALQAALAERFGGRLETDENFAAVHAILAFALDGDKSPAETVAAFIRTLAPDDFAAGHVAYARGIFDMAAPAPEDVNAALSRALGTPGLPPLHAAALVRAGRDAGLTALSDADLLALFAPDKPAGKALAEAVGSSPVAVSPAMLQGLAAGALRPFGGAIHDGVASAALAAPEADFPPEARAGAKNAYIEAGAEPWKADALVAAAFGACGGDAEVRALVLANLDRILVGGNSKLRSEASVRERVEALRANFAELRQLAANDPELFAQGRELLATFHGKALPAGLLGRLVQAAWEQPIGDLQGLSARSRGQALHKAVLRFFGNVDRAMVESGAGDAAYGPDEITACRAFLARRLFSHLGRADLEGLRAALRSPTGAKLAGAYAGIGAFVADRDLSPGLRAALGATGSVLRIQMFEFEDSISRHLGVEPEGIPAAPDPQPRPESFGAAGLVDDALRLARERLAAAKKEAVDTYVRGASPAADRLRAVVSDRLGPEPDGPESILSDTFQSVVGTMLNRVILQDMQKFETGQLTQFDLDRNRGYRIVLAGVGEVSVDPAVARDQFAKFVSKNPAATYASLDRRTRRKAHLAMAIASQGSHNAVNFGFGVVLDPQGRNVATTFAGTLGERVFTMEINNEGGLAVLFRGVQNPTHLLAGGESVPCGPGSRVEAKLDLLVPAEELDRLAGVDFAAYDDGPIAQIVDVDQPENKYRVAKFAFPQDYRIRMDVGPRLVAELV